EACPCVVSAASAGAATTGFDPGDRVCITGSTRPAWGISDIGALLAGWLPARRATRVDPARSLRAE
ncbi:MAG: hypothetical protein ACOC5E_00985, partial [Acidobacteriota bacterium]